MMSVQPELGLMLLVIGLYVYESSSLVFCNQALMGSGWQTGWDIRFGNASLSFMGKEICIAPLLRPFSPQFIGTWRFEAEDKSQNVAQTQWNPDLQKYKALTPFVIWMIAAAFVVLPLGLFSSLGELWILLACAMLYLGVIGLLIYLWLKRQTFKLTTKEFAGIAIEYLICTPFALNVIRRLSMLEVVSEDIECIARRMQTPEQWAHTRIQMLRRLDDQIAYETEDSARSARLTNHRKSLTEVNPS